MLAIFVGVCSTALAQEPRDTPLSPEEELESFQLGDERLTIELVASEPQLDSPVAISWDGDGRLYVAEMIDYPVGPTAGKIRRLEDRDGDGRYEHSTVFATGLNFPNGVLAAQGGVFVTAAPDLLFLKDTNGDGVADQKRVVFTGFGEGNQQLRANGLTWGLDNWIHGANGRSDGNVRRPQDPPEKAVSIRGRDFRFRPDGSQLEATSGQSQFGQTHDDWGNRFISWNTIPIRHALFDQEFLDRNPRLSAYGVLDIGDPTDAGQVYPISPRPQTFNRERTDYFNALSGLTIFRGDGLGPDYVGSAFVGDSLTNLVHRRVLTADGPTFVSRRGEHDREFVASKDSWFHPVYMATGPDGAMYIVDFYRRWVEHPAFVAKGLGTGVDWRRGAGHGRIWKVSRRELTWPPKPAPRMSSESTADVAKRMNSPNSWQRDTAQRVLVERGDPLAAPFLRAIVQQSRLPQCKVSALATLDGLSLLDDSTLLRALEDAEGRVCQFAMRLAAPRLAQSTQLRTAVLKLADFPHTLVRFQLALTLGDLEGPEKVAALVKLAPLEVKDPWIPVAVAGSLGRSGANFLTQLVQKNPDWRRKPNNAQMRFLKQVAEIIAGGNDAAQLASCLELIAIEQPQSVGPGDLALLSGVSQGLADRGQSLAARTAPKSRDSKVQPARFGPLISAARTMAAAENESLEHRLMAVEVLGLLDRDSGKILLALLDPRHAQELQSAAAGALAQADRATAQAMFASWSSLTTATRQALVLAALRSTTTTTALVAALEAEQILPRELEPAVRDGLLAVRDPTLKARIKELFGSLATAPNRQEVVTKFEPLAKGHGDRIRGAAVFEKHCLTCHSVQGRGQRIGPDLSGLGAKPRETLVVDVLDPSRQVAPGFMAYTLLTRQGQVLTGLLVSETATSVTLRRAEGAQDFVLRSQIEELRSTGKSLMPEGFEQSLTEDNLADLFEFLSQPDARLFSTAKP